MQRVEVAVTEAQAHEAQVVRLGMRASDRLRGLPLEQVDRGAESVAAVLQHVGIPDDLARESEAGAFLGLRASVGRGREPDEVPIEME